MPCETWPRHYIYCMHGPYEPTTKMKQPRKKKKMEFGMHQLIRCKTRNLTLASSAKKQNPVAFFFVHLTMQKQREESFHFFCITTSSSIGNSLGLVRDHISTLGLALQHTVLKNLKFISVVTSSTCTHQCLTWGLAK